MKHQWRWVFVVVVLCLFVSAVNAATFTETFQHRTTFTNEWENHGWGSGGNVNTFEYYTDGATYNKGLRIGGSVHPSKSYTGVARTKIPCASNYWSYFLYQVTGGEVGVKNAYAQVWFWNEDQSSSVGFTVYGPYQAGPYGWITTNYHLEFQYESGGIYWKINGVDQGLGVACSFTPVYIGIGGTGVQNTGYGCRFDNVYTEKGIVGICEETNSVNHTITELTNDVVSNTWGINTIPQADYTNSQYDMKVKRATWGEWYDTQLIKNASNSTLIPYGSLTYNWSTLFQTDHYGLYWFNLYRTLSGEPELVGQDFLYFKDVGEPSTINIEETEYAIGDTLNISYYIDSPDFGANQYKIQIFDSTGQLKDERVLTMQADTEYITSTIDWEEGMLYAVLVKDTKPAITEDPPDDIFDLAYDFCTMSNVIYVTGKVYDASNADMLVDGTLLDNVSLNWTQAGTIYNTTSDANGSYVFLDATTLLEVEWFQDVPIEVHAEKTGYSHTDFTMTIIKAGRYSVDIYMVPPQRSEDLENASVAGLVGDDIFHQCIPYASVYIWNATWNNATFTNAWGWYEFNNISNGTYSMYASKETYRDEYEYGVEVGEMSVQLEACDVAGYNEATLDECDATTGWYSDNTLLLDTSDYVESTGSLLANGTSTKDFNKTFSPGIDSNITGAHGYFYLYAKVDNHTNISSANVTITISSNTSGATDKLVWECNKSNFNTTWDLHMLKISNATETGTCNLSNITYFKFESTKSGNVITKIDDLAFVEHTGWDSCVALSIDTSDKKGGTGSLKCQGTPKDGCDLVAGRWWSAPFDASVIDTTSDIARLEFWNNETNSHTTVHYDNIYLEDSDGDYLYWSPLIYSNGTWQERELYLTDASEYGTFDISSIAWLAFYNPTHYYMTAWFDDIRLVQAGQTRQNFWLSQNYNLTVYAKDMDTRYTITTFTAILDSTTVAETTTGAIVFPNITYGIYPLEVSANGYYTNKQYVFMGQDTTQTVYLTKIENVSGGGAGLHYPPRAVEFKVQTLWGDAVDDVTVNITALETSGSSWDWLWGVMGMSQDISSDIENGSMNGTTDSLGRISFMMIETVKYQVHFTKPSESVDTTITVYPKDTHYVILVGTKSFTRDTEWYEAVNFTVTWSETNNTHGYINMSYNDTSNETLSLLLYINNSDRSLVWNQSYGSGCNQTNAQILVNKSGGKAFYTGFSAEHVTFGHSPLDWEQVLKFKWFLDVGIPLDACKYLSIGFLVLFACFFGATTVEIGAVFVSMFAWIFHFIGWLEVRDPATTYLVLTIITTLAVLAYIAARSRRVYRN